MLPPAVSAATARVAQAVTGGAWLLLLVGSQLPLDRGSAAVALCLTTGVAAASCWLRVALRPSGGLPWALMAVGWTAYAMGFLVVLELPGLQHLGPGDLNLSDTVSLLLYPFAVGGLLLLSGARGRRRSAAQVLDTTVVGLACAALATTWAALMFPYLLDGSGVIAVYALAYTVGGATLLVATTTSLASTRWRVDACWGLLLLGFAAMTAGDAVYGMRSAHGTFAFGTSLDALYTAGPVLCSLAAWRRPSTVAPARAYSRTGLAAPALATVTTLLVLVLDHATSLPLLVVTLVAGACLTGLARTALFLRQEVVAEQHLRDASIDDMTGLWNRRALLRELGSRVVEQRSTVLVLLELVGVDRINDGLGHSAGDRVLVEMAGRLQRVPGVRLVARLTGVEFAVVADGSPDGGLALAGALRARVQQSFGLEDLQLSVDARCGSTRLGHGESPSGGELLRRGRVALDLARRHGTSLEAYGPALDTGAKERLALVAELRTALDGDQIVVHLQPKCDPVSRRLLGAEGLVRWQHPVRGLLSPYAFLSGAEEAGLLPQLTRRVLDLSLSAVARLRAEGAVDVQVAVNVGAPDLLDTGLLDHLRARLAAHHLPPAALRLEVTESVVMSDPDLIVATLAAVRAAGIGVSLDDYGTGLSSLSYLRSLPVDELKIDRSFVMSLTSDPASALIVRSTIELAHGLGLLAVAEGVEDEPTLAALVALGCDVVQGYLLGRPVPIEVLLAAGAGRLTPAQPAAADRGCATRSRTTATAG